MTAERPAWAPRIGELVEITTGADAGRRGRVLGLWGSTAVLQLPPRKAAYDLDELQPALRLGPWAAAR